MEGRHLASCSFNARAWGITESPERKTARTQFCGGLCSEPSVKWINIFGFPAIITYNKHNTIRTKIITIITIIMIIIITIILTIVVRIVIMCVYVYIYIYIYIGLRV